MSDTFVLSVSCPVEICGARAGQKCRNYRGVGAAPHAARRQLATTRAILAQSRAARRGGPAAAPATPVARVRGSGEPSSTGKGRGMFSDGGRFSLGVTRSTPAPASSARGPREVLGGRSVAARPLPMQPEPALPLTRAPAAAACGRCGKHPPMGRAPRCWTCLGAAQLLVTAAGDVVPPLLPPAGVAILPARYRFRPVRCGKADCKVCRVVGRGHQWYVYRTWYVDGRQLERYLGPADELGEPYELPLLRHPLPAFTRSRDF